MPAESKVRVHLTAACRVVLGADARLGMAVTARIISQAQADQIAALTPPATPNGAVAPRTGRARRQAAVSPATEVVGYLGATLAMAGVTTLVADSWSDLSSGSRIASLASVATAFLVAGVLVRDEEVDDAAMRLRSFLLLLSTAAAAGAAGLLGDDVLAWSPEGTVRLVGATVAVQWACSGPDAPPARPSTSHVRGPVVVLLVALVVAARQRRSGRCRGLWLFAAAWLLAGWRDLLPPSELALALGGFRCWRPAWWWSGRGSRSHRSPAWRRRLPCSRPARRGGASGSLTGAGVVGVLVFTPYTIVYFFGDTVGVPVAFLVVGVLLLALALRHLRHPGGHPGRPLRLAVVANRPPAPGIMGHAMSDRAPTTPSTPRPAADPPLPPPPENPMDRAFLTNTPTATELILVRHGQQDYPKDLPRATTADWVDPPLSDIGNRQAVAVGESMVDEVIAAVYSSNLERAHETGRQIAGHHGLRSRARGAAARSSCSATCPRARPLLDAVDPILLRRRARALGAGPALGRVPVQRDGRGVPPPDPDGRRGHPRHPPRRADRGGLPRRRDQRRHRAPSSACARTCSTARPTPRCTASAPSASAG